MQQFDQKLYYTLTSYSRRDFSKVNTQFKDENNLDLKQLKSIHFSIQKIFPQFATYITLNIPINHPFVEIIFINFQRDSFLSNQWLFNYNAVFYCYVYDNVDLLTSFNNKLEVVQCFNLQKLQNTKINNKENTFKLFKLRKNCSIYLCVLDG
jgi:hypothetical protein